MLDLGKINLKRVGIATVILVVILPFLTFAGDSKKLYVDSSASGDQTGSSSHPYKTISKALKKAKSGTKIYVDKGTYKENLIVPNGVEIYGEGKDKTVIKAKSGNDSVIVLQGKAKLYGMTIKNGRTGVKVADSGKVKIIECEIQDNDWDGIYINKGKKIDDDNRVSITDSEIENNGRTGVYVEKRKLILMNTRITGNDSDGAFLAAGTSAWIEKVRFNNNGGSGLKAELDYSQVYTKSNSFIDNKREGIEVASYGAAGKIDIYKSRMENNGNYAVSRVQRKPAAAGVWNGLTVREAIFAKVHKGQVSGIFYLYQ